MLINHKHRHIFFSDFASDGDVGIGTWCDVYTYIYILIRTIFSISPKKGFRVQDVRLLLVGLYTSKEMRANLQAAASAASIQRFMLCREHMTECIAGSTAGVVTHLCITDCKQPLCWSICLGSCFEGGGQLLMHL